MKKHLGLIIVIILGFLPLIPLFFPGLPVTHDGQDHIARIANFYLSLSQGNIVPRWADNLNWGYGHPILMFLYPFPSYLASLFHSLGFSFVDSVKLVFGGAYIISGIGMYVWIKKVWGEKAGIVSSVVYLYAPYRFVDMYVRGAIGEHVAFMFIPFTFYFLYLISKKYSYVSFLGLTLSTAGLLLSHNAIALMVIPILFLYGLGLISKKNILRMFLSAVAFILGVGLSSFFLFPAFFEGKYTLRDIVTGGNEYRSSFVPILKFFDLTWNFGGSMSLSKQIGVPIILAFIMGAFFMLSRKKERFCIGIFGGSILVSLFLMTSFSDFLWQNISIIQKFQFPWRFLSVVVFSGSVLSGIVVYLLEKKKVQNILFALLVFSAVLLSAPYIQVNGYVTRPESFYTSVYHSTTDTGESAPRWSVRFMEKEPNSPVEVISGSATITNYQKTSTSRTYIIDAEEDSRIRENTLYFPNWEVFVNGEKITIEFQDPANRGLITYYVPAGKNEVKVVFNDTKLRIITNSVSILSLVCFLGIGIGQYIKNRKV